MKLGKGGNGLGGDGNNKVLIIVLVVLIIGAGAMLARNFIGGSGSSSPSSTSSSSAPAMPDAQPGGGFGPELPDDLAAQNQGGPNPTTQQPAQPAAPAPVENAPQPQPEDQQEQYTINMFGKIDFAYPANWKIKPSVATMSGVFTDGTASISFHSPDPQADNIEKAAKSAVAKHAPSGKTIGQGETQVGGSKGYQYVIRSGDTTMRIVAVDAPSRYILIESAPTSKYDAYKPRFEKLESRISVSR